MLCNMNLYWQTKKWDMGVPEHKGDLVDGLTTLFLNEPVGGEETANDRADLVNCIWFQSVNADRKNGATFPGDDQLESVNPLRKRSDYQSGGAKATVAALEEIARP